MKENDCQQPFCPKGFVSVFAALSFVLLSASGIVLYIAPRGRMANPTGWDVLGFTKWQWANLHALSAVVLIVIVAFHLFFNWRIFWSYLWSAARKTVPLWREAILAIVLCILMIAASAYDWPPVSWLGQWSMDWKEYWETEAELPPWPHAEEATVGEVARHLGLDPQTALERIQAGGYPGAAMDQTIDEIAAAEGDTAMDVFRLFPETQNTRGRRGQGGDGRGGGHGQGRGGRGI